MKLTIDRHQKEGDKLFIEATDEDGIEWMGELIRADA